jgi:hypothetical protein
MEESSDSYLVTNGNTRMRDGMTGTLFADSHLYYSTTQSKLVYKNSVGTVNVLY